MSRGARPQVERRRAEPERPAESVVLAREPEEHLICALLVLEMRRLVWLDEVEIVVARRHRRGPLVRRTEEEVAKPRRPAFGPLQLVLPNLVPRDVGRVGAFHDTGKRLVVIAVELGVVERLGALVDQGVVVVGLLEVEVVLAVVPIRRNELAVDRPVNLPQDGLDLREQVVGRLAAEILNARLVET